MARPRKTTNETETTTEVKVPKKRGRKPNPEKRSGYFYEEEEQAFREYVESDDQHFRDRIFAEKLYPAFTKMIESIIRRYRLFTPSEDFTDTFTDTMSFLITKVNNFDFSKGYKAYSYCGTVCKRYLLLKRTQDMKKSETTLSYDKVFCDGNTDTRTDGSEERSEIKFNNELITRNANKVKEMLENPIKYSLTNNEKKVGYALVEILSNWEKFFSLSTDRKFNKSSFIYFVREYTMLTTKEVRDAMKKYKEMYFGEKKNMISNNLQSHKIQ